MNYLFKVIVSVLSLVVMLGFSQPLLASTGGLKGVVEQESSDQEQSEDEGKFTLEIVHSKEAGYKEIAEYFDQEGEMENVVKELNNFIKLPEDVEIVFEKNNHGPHYSPKDKKIVMSYSLVVLAINQYKKNYPNSKPEEVREYITNVTTFILFHEVGHALIDLYKIPIVGQEEDAADSFASIMALFYVEDGYYILLDSADFFSLLSDSRGENESDYWDEHALDSQRYYRILCLAYGKFPNEVAKELKTYHDKDLNEFVKERGERCQYDFKKDLTTWVELLKPHLKESPDEEEGD